MVEGITVTNNTEVMVDKRLAVTMEDNGIMDIMADIIGTTGEITKITMTIMEGMATDMAVIGTIGITTTTEEITTTDMKAEDIVMEIIMVNEVKRGVTTGTIITKIADIEITVTGMCITKRIQLITADIMTIIMMETIAGSIAIIIDTMIDTAEASGTVITIDNTTDGIATAMTTTGMVEAITRTIMVNMDVRDTSTIANMDSTVVMEEDIIEDHIIIMADTTTNRGIIAMVATDTTSQL